jgi:hypothetical protein
MNISQTFIIKQTSPLYDLDFMDISNVAYLVHHCPSIRLILKSINMSINMKVLHNEDKNHDQKTTVEPPRSGRRERNSRHIRLWGYQMAVSSLYQIDSPFEPTS